MTTHDRDYPGILTPLSESETSPPRPRGAHSTTGRTNAMSSRPVEVLLVEDDRSDVDLTKEALDEAKVSIKLNVVEDGEKAMAYLRRENGFARATRPDLILLDLNLPKKDGREVLREIKSDPDLKTIPVVILSTSDSDTDVTSSYDLGANCFITKPFGFDQVSTVIKAIQNFWLSTVKLPPR
jgi:chemotaxis family two-component system response regulator Rcp1